MATTSAEQLTGEQKTVYTSMVAAGLGLVATVTSLIVATNQSILDNKPLTIGVIVILAISLIGAIAVPIITVIDKGKLTRQKSRQASERLRAREEQQNAIDLALIKEGKLDSFFTQVGEMEVGDKPVKLYIRK